MRIAFYGIERYVGTSANMAAVAAGFSRYQKLPVSIEDSRASLGQKSEMITLTDRGSGKYEKERMKSCDLLVLNLSIPYRELDQAYVRHFLVRENVIFLIGKYYPGQSDELGRIARRYRVDRSRICVIPYNPRFAKAYEDKQVPVYLSGRGQALQSYESFVFEQSLRSAVCAMINYGNRKGEQYYG